MKKTVKILITAAFTVGFGSFAKAQAADITANATVISQAVVMANTNLNFGTIVTGQVKTISPNGDVTVSSGNPLGTANRGAFVVSAQAGTDVTLSFTLPANLSNGSGNLVLLDFDSDGTVGALVEIGNEEFRNWIPNQSYTFNPNFPTYDLNGNNSVNVFIGARVGAGQDTPAGQYTATITLSAAFN